MSDMKIGAVAQSYTPEPAVPLETAADKDSETIREMIKEAKEKVDRHREQLEKIKTKPSYGDKPLEAYARLARAKNKSQVSLAAGFARRQIAQLRAALRTDSENAEEIKAALCQLEKAVSRAGKKQKDIQKEEIAESRRKRLEKEKERERAQRLNAELRRARMMRAFRENGYMHEAVMDGQQQKMLTATRNELREQAQALSGAVAASAEYAAQQYAAAGSAGEAGGTDAAPAPAVDVQA